MAALVILVNKDPRASRHLEERLSEHGYLVAAVTSFAEATKLLETTVPDLLIVDVRLDAYNGLHLAIRTRLDHPDVPVIVTHSGADRVVEAEARHYGAAFIPEPMDNPMFLPTVRAAVVHRQQIEQPVRRWPPRPVPAVERP